MPRTRASFRPMKGRLAELVAQNGHSDGKAAIFADLVECDELVGLITDVFDQGGAVMFGRTSDGGAICVTLFLDDSRAKKYIATREQWTALVAALQD